MKETQGFTLIELLVVVAIIALLSAVLFPVMASARESAKKTASISNLRQISVAWQMYNGDYDDTIMRVRIPGDGKDYYWWGSWDGVRLDEREGPLFPYMNNKGVQADPSFDDTLREAIGFTGYGYNYAYLSPSRYEPPTWEEIPVRVILSQIRDVSQTIAFATCARINNWAYSRPTLEGNAYLEPPSSNYPTFHARANGVGVIVWCDSHVTVTRPAYRNGSFGYGFEAEDFLREHLGDIDEDGSFSTDELFDLN